MTWYFNKVVVCVALIAAIVVLSVFSARVPPGVLAMLQGALGTALAMLLPPVEKTKTGTTIAPPPMHDAKPWGEIYPVAPSVPPAPTTDAPTTKDVKP